MKDLEICWLKIVLLASQYSIMFAVYIILNTE